MVRFLSMLAICLSLLSVAVPAAGSTSISPPSQPGSGPGGSQCRHGAVAEHRYDQGDLEYWLFEPDSPKPDSAPVVIFSHGWSAMNPDVYRAWIDHIVRRGNIVIFPRYQASLRTKPQEFSSNAISATKNALERLRKEPGHVRPQADKLAAVGHSAGGQISAGIAARAESAGLPPVKAVMCVQPGKTWGPRMLQIPLDDVSTIPATTLLVTVAGDCDNIARDIDAKRIVNESVHVPPRNKNFVVLTTDKHGSPPLIASHFAPTAPGGDVSDDMLAPNSRSGQRSGPIRQLIKARLRAKMTGGQGAASWGDGRRAGGLMNRRAAGVKQSQTSGGTDAPAAAPDGDACLSENLKQAPGWYRFRAFRF